MSGMIGVVMHRYINKSNREFRRGQKKVSVNTGSRQSQVSYMAGWPVVNLVTISRFTYVSKYDKTPLPGYYPFMIYQTCI